uniref:Uncharacterized protein n=1 Tax=Diacronema lutheri TaxID=2081491 RepID=A0A7R9UUM4_DIALT
MRCWARVEPRAGALAPGVRFATLDPHGRGDDRSGARAAEADAEAARAHTFSLPPFASLRTSSTLALLPHQLVVACGVATFWRGTWYMMDALCPADPLLSGATCLALGFGSFALIQSIAGPLLVTAAPRGPLAPAARIAALYALGVSAVATWRGVWCLLDVVSENVAGSTVAEHLLHSGVATHIGATLVLLTLGRMTAILAPPAKTGLLNDNRIWSAEPTAIRWLDWGPDKGRVEAAAPSSSLPSASAVGEAARRGTGAGTAKASRRRIQRLYSSDES